jgi:hypothetical protein
VEIFTTFSGIFGTSLLLRLRNRKKHARKAKVSFGVTARMNGTMRSDNNGICINIEAVLPLKRESDINSLRKRTILFSPLRIRRENGSRVY